MNKEMARDILFETDKELKSHVPVQPVRIIREAFSNEAENNEQLVWQISSTPSHKYGVRDNKR